MEKVKNMKKPAIAVLAVVLVLAVSVMGTLAYLTSSQSGTNKAVTNTFIAAGGGHLIDPDAPDPTEPKPGETEPDVPVEPDDPDGPVDPDKPVFGDEDGQLNKGFYLLETKVEYKDNNYVLSEHNYKTLKGNYDKVAPQMELPKDPTLTVNLADGASAYVFVKVINTTQGNLYSPGSEPKAIEVTSDWYEVTDTETITLGLGAGEKLYCYKNAALTGIEDKGNDIDAVPILKENKVIVVDETKWKDTETGKDGFQLGELKFEAYICQAQGFGSPAEAFAECFK